MVAAVEKQFSVGDRVRVANGKGHTPDPTGQETTVVALDGDMVQVSIQNHLGIDIWLPPTNLERIERKFQIGDRVTHPTIPGIGVIRRVLRRGYVQAEFPGMDEQPITSRIPGDILKLAEMESAPAEAQSCDRCQHQQRYECAEGEAYNCALGNISGVMCGGPVAEAVGSKCKDFEEPRAEAIAYVDQEFLDKAGEMYSGMALTKDKAKGLLQWSDREWVVTSAGSQHLKTLEVEAVAVVPINKWRQPSYTYQELNQKRIAGTPLNRTGQRITYKNRVLVITGEQIRFELAAEAVRTAPCHVDGPIERTSVLTPLDSLISEINALYGQLEEAQEVATSAAQSALQFAREMGQRLIQAKSEAGHGNWEQVRQQIKSPRTGKELPSSTATLYQRIAQRWEELSEAETIRDAQRLLKSDRATNDNQARLDRHTQQVEQIAPSKSATVAETTPPPVSPTPAPLNDFHASYLEEAQAIATAPVECRPSITPAEFEAEMAKPLFTGCHLCQHRVLTDSGDRYWCEQGEFDDTLLLKYNWMEMEGGCKSFAKPQPQTKPAYSAPPGVCKLEPRADGGFELHGFTLSKERFQKLAAVARKRGGSVAEALYTLIDEMES